MYINQPNIAIEVLSEEQVRAIKQGYAYSRWKRRNQLTGSLTMIWLFGGLFLIKILPQEFANCFIIQFIYVVGMIVGVIAEIRNLKIVCWTCPNCKKKLPKEEVGYWKKYPKPVLELRCHHCNYDLTQQKVKK